MKQRIFVYGTLKKSQRNAEYLSGAFFLGETMVDNFTAIDRQPYPYAMPQKGQKLKGEIYERSDLDAIDSFENYPNEYDRVEVNTEYGNTWIYIASEETLNKISKPYVTTNDWRGRDD